MLESWWSSSAPRPGLVWGRRRVGKTALIQRFSQERRTIFHTGSGRPAAGELAQFSRRTAAAGLSGIRDLAARPFGDWDDALEHVAQAAGDDPVLVVLDEFPALQETSPELPGVLRAFLDRAHGHTGIRLLLCGSAVRSMEALQEQRAPLFGRFDLRLLLHPFTPAEAGLMLPGMRSEEIARVYGLLGGMPLYLSWWSGDESFEDNIRRLVATPVAPLLTEGELILATEVERGGRAAELLYGIACGRTRYNELKDVTGFEPSRTLDRLIQLRLVERQIPVTENPARTRRRVYRITDNFLAFYLGVVSRYRDEINRGLDSVLPVILDALDDRLGGPWEEAVREHIRAQCAQGRLAENAVAVGPWWTDDGQNEIDALVLAGRARTPVLAAEAKWTTRVDGARLSRALHRKAAQVAPDPDDLTYAIAARRTVDRAPENTVVITAADVFPEA